MSRVLWRRLESGQDASSWMTEYVPGVTAFNYSFLADPPFKTRVLEEDNNSLTVRNGAGMTERLLKGRAYNMPTWMAYPVRDRQSWRSFQKRLDASSSGRFPADWQSYVRAINALECPISMEIGGFFGYINMWVGTQDLMYMFYDDPKLVEDMMEAILDLETQIVRRVTKDIQLDYVWYWEDMAYKGGPMIGPDMVRRFMLPALREAQCQVIRDSGCDVIYLDSDGDSAADRTMARRRYQPVLAPRVCGRHGPVSLAPQVRQARHPRRGAGQARADEGPSSAEAGGHGKGTALAETGPYFPSPDHCVGVDMPFENFCYYINLLHEIRGDEAPDI